MKIQAKIILMILSLSIFSHGQNGLEVGFQVPYSGVATSSTGIISLSYYAPSWNRIPGFIEYGLIGMPEYGIGNQIFSDHRRVSSLIGAFGGHLFLLGGGWLRPGVTVGTVWEETVTPEIIQNPISGEYIKQNHVDSKFAPYFAIKTQILLFSFIFSNIGFGAGINLTI